MVMTKQFSTTNYREKIKFYTLFGQSATTNLSKTQGE